MSHQIIQNDKIDKIIVLDFGSQYNQLIARRIRNLGVYSDLKSYKTTADEIKSLGNVKGIILSGGPNSVYDFNAFRLDKKIYDLEIPILGISYGMQLICHDFGGEVSKVNKKEFGKVNINVDNTNPLFKGLSKNQIVWMGEGDQVETLESKFRVIAEASACHIAACNYGKIYGIQFHPEVVHTKAGVDILKNFVFEICKAEANWSITNYIEASIKAIREEVKDKKVLLGLSGGVDSSVAAVLIHKAIGDQLTCMFVDHGLLRKNEGKQVMKNFKNEFSMDIKRIDASKEFLEKLSGVVDPEEKRKIIGGLFVEVFDRESSKLGDFEFLAQGTLYTDIIESGTNTAQKIKSHHNVGGLPKDMKFKLLEPLNQLFKDEVRELGHQLGLPKAMVNRQPFPGPGLGIRILGNITFEKLELVRESDAILHEVIEKHNLTDSIWQFFTCLPGIKSVGVKEDARSYCDAIIIRAVTSVDGMTAEFARIPYEVLDEAATRIVKEIKNINRVLYDITSKPPGTIEFE